MTATVSIEIWSTPIIDNSGLRYRIEMRPAQAGFWQQRHIWYPPTPHVTEETAEAWIDAGRSGPNKTMTVRS